MRPTTSFTTWKLQNTEWGLSILYTFLLKINHTLMKVHRLQQNPHKLSYIFAFGSHLPPLNFLSVRFLDYFCMTVSYKKVFLSHCYLTHCCLSKWPDEESLVQASEWVSLQKLHGLKESPSKMLCSNYYKMLCSNYYASIRVLILSSEALFLTDNIWKSSNLAA